MNFYNIWIGKGDIPIARKKCIGSFIGMMKEGDSHKILSYNDYKEAIQSVKNKQFWQTYSSRHITFMADFVRLFYACHDPNMLYADTDIDFNVSIRDIDFEPGKPYLGQWCFTGETSLFYVNDCCYWFKHFMNYLEGFNPERLFLPEIFMKPAVQKTFNIIPKSYFKHYHLSGEKSYVN